MKDRLEDWLVAAVIYDLVCDHLQGGWPVTFAEYRAALRRFGARKIRLMPREALEEPLIRDKVLYLPIPRDRRQLKLWLCHELAHFVIEWEGRPALRYPACWGDYEHWASIMEKIVAKGKGPCPEEWLPAELAAQLQDGYHGLF